MLSDALMLRMICNGMSTALLSCILIYIFITHTLKVSPGSAPRCVAFPSSEPKTLTPVVCHTKLWGGGNDGLTHPETSVR